MRPQPLVGRVNEPKMLDKFSHYRYCSENNYKWVQSWMKPYRLPMPIADSHISFVRCVRARATS
ncbi:hypothetical protein MPL3365_280051 [Mesorhizobium plurifarium]|uniref:Uncharacterized protein n=1 Tax=Mesorhizobium plurifarium TaxID=69974 RepID=A0A090G6F5_MESPL|nr:hypothetical protein MPL3365_280051 [Mesorhizobium plurifarium]